MSDAVPIDRHSLSDRPLPPVTGGDKDSKGRILVIAGSRDVPGAALLTATAAMRAGAGKLKIATVASIAPHLAMAMPEAMVVGLPESKEGGFAEAAVERIGALAENADSVVAGPGVEQDGICSPICNLLVARAERLALDAGLLHCLANLDKQPDRGCPPLLLPHAGELASMLDCEERDVESDPVGCGQEAARRFASHVLVKGVTSHIVSADGDVWRHDDGAPGLGVSGSGDALAGIAGGLLARGADPLTALLWAVWLHGEAGERLSRKVGPVGFLAREIAGEIPALLAV